MQKRKGSTLEQPAAKIGKTMQFSSFPHRYSTYVIDCNEVLKSYPTDRGYFELKFNRHENCIKIVLLEDVWDCQNGQMKETFFHQCFYVPFYSLQPIMDVPFKVNRNHNQMQHTYHPNHLCSDHTMGTDISSLVLACNEETHEISINKAYTINYCLSSLEHRSTIGTLKDCVQARALLYGQKYGHAALMLDNNTLLVFIAQLNVDLEKLRDIHYNFQ